MITCLLVHPGAELFGADRMLLESAMGIQEAGIDVVVALAERGPLVEVLRDQGMETVVVEMFVLRKALLRPRSWPKLVSSFVRGAVSSWELVTRVRPSTIYVSTITLPQWPMIALLRRISTITHVHEAEGAGNRWVNLAIYLPHVLAHTVLANSKFSVATIQRSLPGLARRVSIVDNGVAGPPRPVAAPRLSLGGELNVLFLGRLSPRKGPDVIIEAAQQLRQRGINLNVVLAGSAFRGYEWFEAELRDSIRSAGLEPADVLVGFQQNIWPWLEACDVLVVPSKLDEPFGNTAVEGVMGRRPIIVSDTTGLREAAMGYPTAKLIPPDDPNALAAALEGLMEDWENIVGLVDASVEMAQKRHDPALYRRRIGEAVGRSAIR